MFPIRNTVPTRHVPIATWALIALNCGVFLIELRLGPAALDQFLSRFALIPARYFQSGLFDQIASAPGDYLPFFTNMFLHGGWLHLILNMWSLWLFGPAVEDRLGSGRYLGLYLLCGVIASVTHAAFNPTSTEPALGASGAIAGVLGAYLRMFPFARVLVLVPIIFIPLFFDVPAIVFIGFWFLTNLLEGTTALLMPAAGGAIAWWAHVGGFVAGLVLAGLLRQPPERYRPYQADEGVFGFHPSGSR